MCLKFKYNLILINFIFLLLLFLSSPCLAFKNNDEKLISLTIELQKIIDNDNLSESVKKEYASQILPLIPEANSYNRQLSIRVLIRADVLPDFDKELNLLSEQISNIDKNNSTSTVDKHKKLIELENKADLIFLSKSKLLLSDKKIEPLSYDEAKEIENAIELGMVTLGNRLYSKDESIKKNSIYDITKKAFNYINDPIILALGDIAEAELCTGLKLINEINDFKKDKTTIVHMTDELDKIWNKQISEIEINDEYDLNEIKFKKKMDVIKQNIEIKKQNIITDFISVNIRQDREIIKDLKSNIEADKEELNEVVYSINNDDKNENELLTKKMFLEERIKLNLYTYDMYIKSIKDDIQIAQDCIINEDKYEYSRKDKSDITGFLYQDLRKISLEQDLYEGELLEKESELLENISKLNLSVVNDNEQSKNKYLKMIKNIKNDINNGINNITEKITEKYLSKDMTNDSHEIKNNVLEDEVVTLDNTNNKAKNIIGGVDLNYANIIEVPKEIKTVDYEISSRSIKFIGLSNNIIEINKPISDEIMSALIFLKNQYNDISCLSFTLNINANDNKITENKIIEYLRNTKSYLKENIAPYPINSITVKNYPFWMGAEYADTIIGKIALDADIALKFLSLDIDPKTKKAFRRIPELTEAVKNMNPSFIRQWLFLKAANIELKNNVISIKVKIGINTKSIKYISENDTIDIGDAPKNVKSIATILENNFDKISEIIPSWKALKEVYRGIAIIQLADSLGVKFKAYKNEKEIRKYKPPSFVDGVAAFTINKSGIITIVGGVNYALKNKYNLQSNDDNNYFTRLYQIIDKESHDPYWRSISKFNNWQLRDVIKECNKGINMNINQYKLMNIRANAMLCLALKIPRPNNDFDPEVLSTIIQNNYVFPSCHDENMKIALYQVKKDYVRSKFLNPANKNFTISDINLELFMSLYSTQAEKIYEKALHASNEKEKLYYNILSAEQFIAAGNYEEAAKRLRFVCQKNPKNKNYQKKLTMCLYNVAIEELRKDTSVEPILVLPFKNVTKNIKHDWLSNGISYILYNIIELRKENPIVNPKITLKMHEILNFNENSIYGNNVNTIKLMGLINPQSNWLVYGDYTVFGKKIKLNINIFNKTDNSNLKFEMIENLSNPYKLFKKLYQSLMFVIFGSMSKNLSFVNIPFNYHSLLLWCDMINANNPDYSDNVDLEEIYGERINDLDKIVAKAMYYNTISDYKNANIILSNNKKRLNNNWIYYYIFGKINQKNKNYNVAKECYYKSFELNPSDNISILYLKELLTNEKEIYNLNKIIIEAGYTSILAYLQNALIENKNGNGLEAYRILSDLLSQKFSFNLLDLNQIKEVLSTIDM